MPGAVFLGCGGFPIRDKTPKMHRKDVDFCRGRAYNKQVFE